MSFPIEQQQETNWCWAAVSSSADHYFDSASTRTQCNIASTVLSRNCCANSSICNISKKLHLVLDPMGRLASAKPVALDFPDLRRELDADRPVAVRIGWFGGGAHFVLITGYTVTQSGVRLVEIADSRYGDEDSLGNYFGMWEIDFDLFPEEYQDGGTWTATYLLKRKAGDVL